MVQPGHSLEIAALFERSRTATCNSATGREFVNVSASDARLSGAPLLAMVLEALACLGEPLNKAASGGARGQRTTSGGSAPSPWWGTVAAPRRGMIQRYPPGSKYDTHDDTHWLGDGWVSPRTFTAIVYVHEGWDPAHGGELIVQPPGSRPGMAAYADQGATIVPPRGGTLALFPSHLLHAVAPVAGSVRYAVTLWLSLWDRMVLPLSSVGVVAARLPATQWVDIIAKFNELARGDNGQPHPGTIVGNMAVDHAARRAAEILLPPPASPTVAR